MSSPDTSPNASVSPWPEPRDFRRSIRLEFALMAAGLFMTLMLVSGYVVTMRSMEAATRSVVDKLVVQARAFSGPAGKHILAVDGPDALLLQDICNKLGADNPDIYWAGIADADDSLLAHTDLREVVTGRSLRWPGPVPPGDLLRPGESFAVYKDTVFITTPIRENDVRIGRLGLAASAAPIRAARDESIVATASISLLIILIGVPLSAFVLHHRLRPVTVITDQLRRIDPEHLELDIPVRTRNEFGYLAATLRVMGERLESARQERVERDRINRELEIAREIQAGMLPRGYPRTERYEFAGAYRSAREVGGDYYDFLPIDERYLGVLVADVSGKSLPGMLVMLMTRDVVKTAFRTHQDPARLLCAVNRELRGNIRPDMFVTMFFGVLDTMTGEFSFASAGHNPLVRLNAGTGTSQLVRCKGYPLGMMPPEVFNARIELMTLRLQPGDWVVQYTDGVNEALNTERQEFGLERFMALLRQGAERDAEHLVEGVLAGHRDFVGDALPYDDITILALKWKGAGVDNPIRGTVQRLAVNH